MKRRFLEPESTPIPAEDSLCRALLALEEVEEMRAFLRELCTPAELEALIDRWRVVPYILQGLSYREIHERTSVSVTTIGRVARFLQQIHRQAFTEAEQLVPALAEAEAALGEQVQRGIAEPAGFLDRDTQAVAGFHAPPPATRLIRPRRGRGGTAARPTTAR